MIERSFIEQGIKRVNLEEYLAKELEKAGFTKSEIEKTPLVTRIIVNVIRPGLAIGKGGSNIRKLTETIENEFGIENPQLEIKEIAVPELDAKAMVNRIRGLIERGFSWRSISYRSVKDIESKGAQGIELILSGKLTGKGGRKRKQRIAVGYMKKVGDQVKLVDFAKATAYPKPGAIGIKLRIVRPETVFPDKVNISELLKERKQIAEDKEKEEKKEAEEEKKEKDEKEVKKEEKSVEKKEKANDEKEKKPLEKKSEKEKTKEVTEKKSKEKSPKVKEEKKGEKKWVNELHN